MERPRVKYRLLLLTEGGAPSDAKAEVVFATDEKSHIALIQGYLTTFGEDGDDANSRSLRTGPKGRAVFVMSLAADSPVSVSRVTTGMVFQCAADASLALGYKYNAVALQLNKVKGTAEPRVVLKGVELCYADDIGRVD
jgi:hypothetical protein